MQLPSFVFREAGRCEGRIEGRCCTAAGIESLLCAGSGFAITYIFPEDYAGTALTVCLNDGRIMHKYLKAAGFSGLNTERQLYDFITSTVLTEENITDRVMLADGCQLIEYRQPASEAIGLCAGVIEFGNGRARLDYYYPYFRGDHVSSEEICTVERYTERENFAGLIDEYKIGLSLIFFVSNPIAYRKRPDHERVYDFRGSSLTAFCNEAMVILPIEKKPEDIEGMNNIRKEQEHLMEAAREGDEEAIETLTATDMNMFQQLSRRIESEDLYSVVEQSLMPSGMECDLYSVIGEITDVDETSNHYSGDGIWLLSLNCNDVAFTVAIRKADLIGEPAIGRRFKGKVWLQGEVNFDRPELMPS